LNILYADGHVEFWPLANALPLLDAAHDAASKRAAAATTQPVAETQAK
jgi:hypothetical protein